MDYIKFKQLPKTAMYDLQKSTNLTVLDDRSPTEVSSGGVKKNHNL